MCHPMVHYTAIRQSYEKKSIIIENYSKKAINDKLCNMITKCYKDAVWEIAQEGQTLNC